MSISMQRCHYLWPGFIFSVSAGKLIGSWSGHSLNGDILNVYSHPNAVLGAGHHGEQDRQVLVLIELSLLLGQETRKQNPGPDVNVVMFLGHGRGTGPLPLEQFLHHMDGCTSLYREIERLCASVFFFLFNGVSFTSIPLIKSAGTEFPSWRCG